jgi:L-lactate dehydrogenase complex protein LldF
MSTVEPIRFHENAKRAVSNPAVRANIRSAMDFLVAKRAVQFPDPIAYEALRTQGEHIRQYSLSKLPELLLQLERNLTRNGIQVHWAETPEEACKLIIDITKRAGGELVVKGKSMVSEEIELNHALEAEGIGALESDMGEYIVQLAGEKPSHIIMPAIHKTKEEIARLLAEKVPGVDYTDSVDELIQIGRNVLRDKFRDTKVGLSGVNVAVAETGTLCLVENEGNGRMCTTVPNVHIAVTGIEKVVEKLSHVPPLLTLLTRSATGQAATTYFNWISGPRGAFELDGPKEVHLVLLDNGRSAAYADKRLRSTLQCIRCGACMNHCPVYSRIGGHAYGTTYPGPIGKIISPHLMGLKETADLVTASSLCGACGEVCPVKIPIPDLLIELRQQSQGNAPEPKMAGYGSGSAWPQVMAYHAWAWLYARPMMYRGFSFFATRLRLLTPTNQGAWTRTRTPLRPAGLSLHERIKALAIKHHESIK